jgi:hypothetical protein
MMEQILQSLQQNAALPSMDSTGASNPVGIPDPKRQAQFDCLCKAMNVMSSSLAIMCTLSLCGPCCGPAAFLAAVEKLLESFGICDPKRC